MMKWTHRHTLFIGTALILMTNLVAMVGVWYNRSETPDSILKLSQRELKLPYEGRTSNDNSGISLSLVWRSLEEENRKGSEYRCCWNSPAWLDKAKLAALGFDISQVADTNQGRIHFENQTPRPAFLVLEFNGPAYRRTLEMAKQSESEEQKKGQPTLLQREQTTSSRLFLVDAGLDREKLRAQYPDSTHYAIVHGKIRPMIIQMTKQPIMSGYVEELSAESINVPLQVREVFEPVQRFVRQHGYYNETDKQPAFEATIAFGKRLEPWIVEASGK